MEIEIV